MSPQVAEAAADLRCVHRAGAFKKGLNIFYLPPGTLLGARSINARLFERAASGEQPQVLKEVRHLRRLSGAG
jgi:hypothetical protein